PHPRDGLWVSPATLQPRGLPSAGCGCAGASRDAPSGPCAFGSGSGSLPSKGLIAVSAGASSLGPSSPAAPSSPAPSGGSRAPSASPSASKSALACELSIVREQRLSE